MAHLCIDLAILMMPFLPLLFLSYLSLASADVGMSDTCRAPIEVNTNAMHSSNIRSADLFPAVAAYIETLLAAPTAVDPKRLENLQAIANYIGEMVAADQDVHLVFICTHNSRRSHLGQIWAAVAAHYHGLAGRVHTHSAGTEATAFNPRAVFAIRRAGLEVDGQGGENPVYSVRYADEHAPLLAYSKTYLDAIADLGQFGTIMTCSDADRNCPFIPGAALRVALPYDDPKAADDTPEETARYDERCRQIAVEMLTLMSLVKKA